MVVAAIPKRTPAGRVWRSDHATVPPAAAESAKTKALLTTGPLPLQVLPPNIDEEGCITEVFNYLWSKHPTTREGCQHISLPETIVFKFRQPASWFFVASDGQLRKKRQVNITNANIFEVFSRVTPTLHSRGAVISGSKEICAIYVYTRLAVGVGEESAVNPIDEDRPRLGQRRVTCVEHFTAEELEHFLFRREKGFNGILQQYVKPAGLNHSLMVVWTPNFFLCEKRFDVKEAATRQSPATHSSRPELQPPPPAPTLKDGQARFKVGRLISLGIAHCFLLTTHYVLLTLCAYCSLLTAYCFLHCLMLTTYYSVLTAYC